MRDKRPQWLKVVRKDTQFTTIPAAVAFGIEDQERIDSDAEADAAEDAFDELNP